MKRTIAIVFMILTISSVYQSTIRGQENDHLLFTEFVVTPTAGEFIEIYNPTSLTVDLSNYYLTDATHASSGRYYYNIVTGDNYGGGSFSDFHARFPEGATISPGEYQTIALDGDANFFNTYGVYPTYEIAEDAAGPADVPDMREAVPRSVQGLTSGLTNGDEVIVLYYWNGITDLVQDVDYVVYDNGGQVPDEAIDKTGLKIDGPDADTDSSTYLNDTPITNQELVVSPASGSSAQRIDNTENGEVQAGGNGITGHDEMSERFSQTWIEAEPTPNTAYAVESDTINVTLQLNTSTNLDTLSEDAFVEVRGALNEWNTGPVLPGRKNY